MSAQRYDAIVVGGGVNGLTAAGYLARAGKRVLVCERRNTVGGLCSTEEFHPGFRANVCVDDPGWMPSLVRTDLGVDAAGYAESLAAVSMSIPVAGGAPLVISPDIDATARAIQPHSSRDASRWPAFCELVARLSGFLETLSGIRAPMIESNAPADLFSLMSLGKTLRGLGKRGMVDLIRTIPMPVADLLDEWFENDALEGALSTLGVLNVQHGPQSGGTALVFLHYHVGLPLGGIGGRRVVRGGVGALPTALASAVGRLGGTIRSGTEVSAIRVRDDQVLGVALASGEEIDAPVVVSSADPRRTFSTLVDAGDFDPEFLHAIDSVRMRGPQVRVHIAARDAAGLADGTVIAPTTTYVERAYDAAKHRRIAEQPFVRVSVPSAADSSFAIGGGQVITAHAQYAAYAPHEPWTDATRSSYADSVIRILSSVAPALRTAVVHSAVLAPPDVEATFGATQGSVLHGELTLDQFLFARPVASVPRYAAPVDGLWLCGSATHPGAGTAGASGRLAAQEVLAALKRSR